MRAGGGHGSAGTGVRRRWRNRVMGMMIALTVLGVFRPAMDAGFLTFDDDRYVTKNEMVLQGLTAKTVTWAFTGVGYANNWHPLTWLSHMADVELFGRNPAGHHLASVLLHAAGACLLFRLLAAMTGSFWAAAAVAALFGLHPLRVESVVWVAERKDVLAGVFFMLTLLAYVRFLRRPAPGGYLLVATLYVLALLAKPMAVTIPFVLLLLDFWPLGRIRVPAGAAHGWRRPVLEKLPLLLPTAGSAAITLIAQGSAVEPLQESGAVARLSDGLVAYGFYLWKTVWPSGLAYYYPRPQGGFSLGVVGASTAVLFLLSLAAAFTARRRPYLLAGWLWYLGILFPVSGLLVRAGAQAMADRYTYLPLTGILIAVVWGLADAAAWRRWLGPALGAAGLLVLIPLSLVTRTQIGYWHDDERLFGHALRVTRDNWIANSAMGVVRALQGRDDEAMRYYLEALRIEPDYQKNQFNLGLLLAKHGRYDEAIPCFENAILIDPLYIKAYINLGVVLGTVGRWGEGLPYLKKAVELEPGNIEARRQLSLAMARASGMKPPPMDGRRAAGGSPKRNGPPSASGDGQP